MTPKPLIETWRTEHLKLAIEAADVALWSWNVDTNHFCMDDRAFGLWGLDWAAEIEFETLSAQIHPADRDRVRAAFLATRTVAARYEIDFRIVLGHRVRWISARGHGGDVGIVDRTMFGVFLDVTGRKQAEEGHELLAGEMSHRVKNLLAIASGLTRMTSRSAVTVQQQSADLIGRLTALDRAHDIVRPLPGHHGRAALLGDLFAILLAPYDDTGAFAGRIRVAVPRMGVGVHSATTLALVIHELATNAMKYGSLSTAEGMLDISGASEGSTLTLTWAETGGPRIARAPSASGFGSSLLRRSIFDHLQGDIELDWQAVGLIVTMRLDTDRLAV